MAEASVKEMRDNLKVWLDRAEAGEEIVVTRRGREVARLVPPQVGAAGEPEPASPDANEAVLPEADSMGTHAIADPADVEEIDAVIRRRIESGVFPTVQEIRRLVEIHGESAWTDLGAMRGKHGGVPDLSEFRRSIKLKGEAASDTVIRMRRDARY